VIAFRDIPQLEDGKIIGNISCSGGTDAQDEVACMTGVTTINN
jgi:uncharacterized protein GlcG (DUF336 family)